MPQFVIKNDAYDIAGIVLKAEVEEGILNKTFLRIICEKNDKIKPGDVVSILLVAHERGPE